MIKYLLIIGIILVLFVGIILNTGNGNYLPSFGLTTPSTSETLVSGGEGEISLEIKTPIDKQVVNNSKIQVKGTTSANAEVFVNEFETKSSSSGEFSVNLTLDEGENTISVSVNDAKGNYLEKEIVVIYNLLD